MRSLRLAALAVVAVPLFAQINPPVITKTFSNALRPAGSGDGVTITITNPNPGTSLTGVGFVDNLPAGSVVYDNLTNTCNGTVAVIGSPTVTLSGVTLPPNGSCMWLFGITMPTPGTITNTVQVTSSNGGTGNTASASALVSVPQVVTKTFTPSTIALNGSSTMTFTIQNPNPWPFSPGVLLDDMNPGLVVSSSPAATNTCGGTFTAVAGSSSIRLDFGPIAANSTCTASVDVTGTTLGGKYNVVNVYTPEALTVSASATLTVAAADLAITKARTASFAQGESGAMYTIAVRNTGAGPTDGSPVIVTDTLPAGLTATAISGAGWTCTLSPLSCTTSDVLAAGASYPPITLAVNVSAAAGTSVTNTAVVSGGGDNNAANNTATDTTTIVQVVPTLSPLLLLLLGAAVVLVAIRAIAQR